MKNDKLNDLSNKLLQKLNEDYALFEANDGDGLSGNNTSIDQKKATKKVLSNKAKEIEAETQEANAAKNAIQNPRGRAIWQQKHKKLVIDREDEKNRIRKFDFATGLEEEYLNIDELSDNDYCLLAEEFEMDLNEAGDALNQYKEIKQAEFAKQKEELNDKSKDLTANQSELKDTQAAEKQKESTELADKQAEEQKKLQEKQAELDKQKEEVAKAEAKKMEQIKQAEEKQKEAQNNMNLSEGFKERRNEKKWEKLSKAKGDISVKLDELYKKQKEIKGKIADTTNDRRRDKYQNKLLDIEGKIRELEASLQTAINKYEHMDDKIASQEFKQSLKEEIEFNIFIDDINMPEPNDESLKDDEDEKVLEVVNKSVGKENNLQSQFSSILNTKTDDPMLLRIIAEIKIELANADPDTKKLQELKMKFLQYKK